MIYDGLCLLYSGLEYTLHITITNAYMYRVVPGQLAWGPEVVERCTSPVERHKPIRAQSGSFLQPD